MSRWPLRSLGDLIENRDALRVPVKEADRRRGPHPYYGASGIVDYVDSFIFEGEHLLVAEDGENLRTRATPVAFRATGKFWVNNHAHVVRGRDGNSTRFLEYALRIADIDAYLTGAVMPKLTQGNLHRIQVIVPSREEQHAIARILGALDDKIDLNRRTNETLEAIVWAVVESRRAAEDWPSISLADAGVSLLDCEHRTPAAAPSGYPYIAIPQIRNGRLVLDDVRLISTADYVDWTRRTCPRADDVIVVRRCNPGDTAVVPQGLQAALGQNLVLLRADGRHVLPRVLRWLICGPGWRQQVDKFINVGAVFDSLRCADIPNFCVPVPSLASQQRLLDEVGSHEIAIERNRQMNQSLTTLRDTLLPKLLSGELRVPDAERAVAAAL
jgi:type I restriction enzyme S subunit